MPGIYPIQYDAPQLRGGKYDIYKLSARAGRDEGYNKFLEGYIENERDRSMERLKARLKANQEAAAARAKAAADASSDPNHQSFWDKLDQFYYDKIQPATDGAVEWTMDKLSRPIYGVANAGQALLNADDDEKKYKDRSFLEKMTQGVTGKSGLEIIDDVGLDTAGDMISAFWKGFSGKEKTTFSHVIKHEAKQTAKNDPDNPGNALYGNPWYQGTMGLVGDIAFDPTSYVGVGLVTKPLKLAKGSKALEGTEKIKGVAREIEKLGIKRPTGERAGFAVGSDGVATAVEKEVPVGFDEIYAMLGGRASKTRLTRKAQQAERVRNVSESLPKLKEWIRKDPDLPTDETIAKLEQEIGSLKKQRKAAMDEFTNDAYQAKLKEFDENPKLWEHIKAPERKSLLSEAERALPIARTAAAFSTAGKVGFKDAKTGVEAFHKAMPKGWHSDERISAEFRDRAFDDTLRIARTDAEHQTAVKANIAINKQIKELNTKISNERKLSSPDQDQIAKWTDEVKRAEAKKKINYEKQNMARAAIFHRLVRHHIENGSGLSDGVARELEDLLARKAELDHQASMIDSSVNRNVELSESSVRTSSESPDLVYNERTELRREAYDINRRIREITSGDDFLMKEDLPLPKDLTDLEGEITEDFLKISASDSAETKAWKKSMQREVDARIEAETEQIIEKKLRDLRTPKATQRVSKMFGNPALSKVQYNSAKMKDKFKLPKIKVDGQDIYARDKNILAQHVTDADIHAAAERTAGIKGSTDELYETLNEIDQTKRMLREGITPSGKNIDVLESQQLERSLTDLNERLRQLTHSSKTHTSPESVAFERMFKDQHKVSLKVAMAEKRAAISDFVKDKDALKTKKLTAEDRAAAKAEAKQKVYANLNSEVSKKGSVRAMNTKDLEFEAFESMDAANTAYKAALAQAKEEYASTVYSLKESGLKGQELTEKINEAQKLLDTKRQLHAEAFEEAKKTRTAMADKLDEQVLLDMLNENIAMGKNYVRISAAGIKIADVATPKIITQATEKIGGLPILQAAHQTWAQAFRPASKIEPELNLARLRAQGRTNDIIKHHVDDIRHRFSQYKPAERKDALHSLRIGAPVGNQTLVKEMDEYFDELVPYLNGRQGIFDDEGKLIDALKPHEVNHYLPEQFKFTGQDSKFIDNLDFSNSENIIKNMRRLPQKADAMEVMWNLRIASEKALAVKNMRHVISSQYGVKRVIPKKDELLDAGMRDRQQIVESLQQKHGWTTIGDLGEEFYFAPEVKKDVMQLLDMMKPQNVHRITQLYDKVIRGWKSAVTVYNPGYYTRNGIGEVMMGIFDGLTDPRWYVKAKNTLRYAMPDAMEDTLKQLEPWKHHQSTAQKGAKVAFTTRRGKKVTYEDVWVLYHDTNLKSGFISSEFDHYFPAAGTLKASKGMQALSKTNDKVRNFGEKYEDYFRLSHFMYRMQKSGYSDVRKAAEEAAQYVRKYHFDYTDFTQFEKTTMMRVFPFYKWTRKAFPLMASMVFTKPGAVMLYPKAMQNMSYATGGTNPLKDNNGFYPNYEKVTPLWMRGLMSYPMGRDVENNMTYGRLATPQFDVYGMAQNPVSAAAGMLSPGIKAPLEQLFLGHPIDPEWADMKMEGSQDRASNLARITPAGSLLMNIFGEAGKKDSAISEPSGLMDEKLASFLTGAGLYENNESRKKGEKFRRNMEKGGR